jgi:hypothetical protein
MECPVPRRNDDEAIAIHDPLLGPYREGSHGYETDAGRIIENMPNIERCADPIGGDRKRQDAGRMFTSLRTKPQPLDGSGAFRLWGAPTGARWRRDIEARAH